jgi:hypothetical protein
MKSAATIFLTAAIMLSLAACTDVSPAAYPNLYADALQRHRGAPPPPDGADRFSAFFTALHSDGWEDDARRLYAEPLYFNDTLFTTDNLQALIEHFARVRDTSAVEVTIDDTLTSGNDVYLRWRMRACIQFPLQPAKTETIGMTLLRFNESGQIVFHQDFWDSTEGFYRHVPLVGTAINQVRNRFSGGT